MILMDVNNKISNITTCPSVYSKTCVKRPLSNRPKIVFQDQLSLNVEQKYCRMLQGVHSAILSTFIRLQFDMKIFVFFSIFEWLFYIGFSVVQSGPVLLTFCKVKYLVVKLICLKLCIEFTLGR